MTNLNNDNGWTEWGKHVLAELVRLNDEFKQDCIETRQRIDKMSAKVDKISDDIADSTSTLSRHDEYITLLKDASIIEKVNLNSSFRENTKALI
ncbi:MAG: hypothetical protein WC565_05750 [Parcubacteria group bacterium]|nr:hypothetical protein [Methanoregula sp.]